MATVKAIALAVGEHGHREGDRHRATILVQGGHAQQ
jgi:hypothetical protein